MTELSFLQCHTQFDRFRFLLPTDSSRVVHSQRFHHGYRLDERLISRNTLSLYHILPSQCIYGAIIKDCSQDIFGTSSSLRVSYARMQSFQLLSFASDIHPSTGRFINFVHRQHRTVFRLSDKELLIFLLHSVIASILMVSS